MTLLGAEPQLFVTDLEASLGFYARLGFAVAFSYGDPPFYAQVRRDAAALNLRLVEAGAAPMARRETVDEGLSATIVVDDPELHFDEFDVAGVEFHQRLRTEPWGARTFMIADPDGNLILFAGAGT